MCSSVNQEAKKAIKLIEEALETIEQKAKEQKIIAKAELKDELRKELATKEDIAILDQKLEALHRELDQKLETVRQEIQTVRHEMKGELKVLKLLIYVTIVMMVILNKGTVEYLVNLLKAM